MPPRLKKNDTPVRRDEEAKIITNKIAANKQRIKNKEGMQASKELYAKKPMVKKPMVKTKKGIA